MRAYCIIGILVVRLVVAFIPSVHLVSRDKSKRFIAQGVKNKGQYETLESATKKTARKTGSSEKDQQKEIVMRRAQNGGLHLDVHGVRVLSAEKSVTLQGNAEKRYGARTETFRRAAKATRLELDSAGTGAFLNFETGGRDLERFDVALGTLPADIRTLALSRIKRWWMAPSFNNFVPLETQLLLIEMPYSKKCKLYVAFLPLISDDGSFRCTLWDAAKSKDTNIKLRARCESGDPSVTTSRVGGAMWIGSTIATDASACHDLIERGIKEASQFTSTQSQRKEDDLNRDGLVLKFRPLAEKKIPQDVLAGLGWCTWDACYSAVDAQAITNGLSSIGRTGTKVQRLIIDDGWMQLDREFEQEEEQNFQTRDEGKAIISDLPSEEDIESSAAMAEESTKALLSGVTLTGETVSKSAATFLYQKKEKEMRSLFDAVSTYIQRVAATTLGSLYSNIVESGDDDGVPVTLWRWAATKTALRDSLIEFYDGHTDFTRRINWPPRPHETKFGGIDGMRALVQDTVKEKYGVKHVTCWHAVAGFWGGVAEADDASAPSLPLERLRSKPTPHLRHVEPSIAWDPASLKGLTTPTTPDAVSTLYNGLYGSLKQCGVDAIKADAQSGVGPLGHRHGGGPNSVRMYIDAMENSAQRHFLDSDDALSLTNCMCHSTENLFSYASSAVARASDDFYPRDEASWRFHVTACAFNSMLISTIAYPDYDMFQSRHEAGWLHAAARCVSGGPVTLSDAPGAHDPNVLNAIALPDGTTLLAEAPARLAADCIFNDVTSDHKTPLKLVAPNACGGAVIGVFNLQGSFWSRKRRCFELDADSTPTVTATIAPKDALPAFKHHLISEDAAAAASARALSEDLPFVAVEFDRTRSKVYDFRQSNSVSRDLEPSDFAVFALARLRRAHKAINWAPIGLINMLNAGGAVRQVVDEPDGDSALILARGPGTFAIFSEARPESIQVDDSSTAFDYQDRLISFELPASSVNTVDGLYRIRVGF